MNFEAFLSQYTTYWTDSLGVMIGIHVFIILVLWRAYHLITIYFGAKGFVKKSNRLRRKKYNGPDLVQAIAKKRKRNTNSYAKLRRGAKTRVEKFFQYKTEELPGVTNYSHGKLFKKNRKKLIIFVSNGRKKILKVNMKKAKKQFIEITNKYDCLDEFIQYLHNLPEAILNHQDYDIFISEHDVSIGYQIK